MPDEHDALSEIQRLRKASRRWRAVALVSLGLLFLVILPFLATVKEVVRPLRQGETNRLVQEFNAAWAAQQKEIQDLKKQLKENVR